MQGFFVTLDGSRTLPRFALLLALAAGAAFACVLCAASPLLAQDSDTPGREFSNAPESPSAAKEIPGSGETTGRGADGSDQSPVPDHLRAALRRDEPDGDAQTLFSTPAAGAAGRDEPVDPMLTAEEREARAKRREISPILTAEEREYRRQQSANGRVDQADENSGDENAVRAYDRGEGREEENGADPLATGAVYADTYSDPPLRGRADDLPPPPGAAEGAGEADEAFGPYPTGKSWLTYHPSEADPFAPIGLRVGSFIAYPELIIEGYATDNAFLAQQIRRGDEVIEFRPTLLMESDWSRHAVNVALRGTFNSHNEYHSENEKAWSAELRGRLDITRRTNLEGEASYDLSQEGRGELDFPGGAAERTDIETLRAGGGLNHRFNRLTVSVHGFAEDVRYANTPLIGGGIQNNDDRDYAEYEGTLRLAYDFKPGFAVFAEGEISARDFKLAVDSTGFQRSSSGHAIRGGILIDIGPKLRGEVSVGQAWQAADDPRLSDIDGVIVDANLQWLPFEYTTVTFLARSEIEPTSFGTASGIFERYYGAEIRHAIRRDLILTAGIDYLTEDYHGANTTQNTLGVEAGAEYILSRHAAILGKYEYTQADGDGTSQAYHENEVRLGLRLRR